LDYRLHCPYTPSAQLSAGVSPLRNYITAFQLNCHCCFPRCGSVIGLVNVVTHVRIQVLTAARVKMTAFWDTAPCSLVEVDRRFRRAYCLEHQVDECITLITEAVRTSKMSVYFKDNTKRCISESWHLQGNTCSYSFYDGKFIQQLNLVSRVASFNATNFFYGEAHFWRIWKFKFKFV
jgi:hypothetical protein